MIDQSFETHTDKGIRTFCPRRTPSVRNHMNHSKFLSLLVFSATAVWVALSGSRVTAGGPENLVLVVNADSASSKMIANHYIALRNIPSQNVIYLNNIPDAETTTLVTFRENILKPVLKQIEQRRLVRTVDYIVYSSDFPTAVNVGPHWQKLSKGQKTGKGDPFDRRLFAPVASISSLTFFAAAIMTDQPTYMRLDSNNYYRRPASLILRYPFSGKSQQAFEAVLTKLSEAENGQDQEQKNAQVYRDAIETLKKMANENPRQVAVAYMIARCYGMLGDARNAASWLQRSAQLGWIFRSKTEKDAMFAKVSENENFQRILQKIPNEPFDLAPTRGFRAQHAYAPNGSVNTAPGQGNRHFLSTVLAVTRNQGNTEREALAQIRRSVRADGTKPTGKFYFTQTADVRSTTRQPNFPVAISALKRLGFESEVVTTKMPVRVKDILGVTSGTPQFNWTLTGSKLMPGAIGDNFTSFGGRLAAKGQTKLTEFLRQGAAGASGTVVEPYSVQAKFPHPMIHAHYARGCTLAEAFYQSVSGPSQLLIVGDPLCRPFASIPIVDVTGVQPNDMVSGKVSLNFDTKSSPSKVIGLQLFVDGRIIHQQAGLRRLEINTTDLSDGYHELRIIGIAGGPIQTSCQVVLPINVDNQGHAVSLKCEHSKYLDTDTIELMVKSNFGDELLLIQNNRPIAKQQGDEATFKIKASSLGRGPIRLEAIAVQTKTDGSDPSKTQIRKSVSSMPLSLTVEGRISSVRQIAKPKKQTKKNDN